MRVLGIDVAKNSIVCCLLSAPSSDIRKDYRDSTKFYKFNADASGIQQLLSLLPDCAILEPTGTNYSRLWQVRLEQAGIQVYLVGHCELSSYRKSQGLPDKDDEADSLALANYYFDFHNNPKQFVAIRQPVVFRLRSFVLSLEHYAHLRNAIINRIKQELSWQFPEVSSYSVKRKFLQQSPLLWRWLAGISSSSRYDRLYQNSCGEGLEFSTRQSAKILCEIYNLEIVIEKNISQVLANPLFEKYIQVFELFGFNEKFQALLLTEVYPLEKFFGANGQPEIVVSTGKVSGKLTKKNLSLRRFKKTLAAAPIRDWSGERKSNKKNGPTLIKAKFYLWILSRISQQKTRPQNQIGEKLGGLLDELNQQKMPTRKAWAKVRCKTVEMLYEQLKKQLL